jgi:Fe-S-cluster containining protein
MIDLAPSSVPCGTCAACCRGDILLMPGDDASLYETVDVAHPVTGEATKRLAQRENGECVYKADGCSVYETRPVICKAFDCRRFAASFDKVSEPEQRTILHFIHQDVIDAGRQRAQ